MNERNNLATQLIKDTRPQRHIRNLRKINNNLENICDRILDKSELNYQ